MICPQQIARENKFVSVDVGYRVNGQWVVTVHGKNVGEFGCEFGYGGGPEAALADVLNKVRIHREDRAAIAAGNRAAMAKRIADLKSELTRLTGEPA